LRSNGLTRRLSAQVVGTERNLSALAGRTARRVQVPPPTPPIPPPTRSRRVSDWGVWRMYVPDAHRGWREGCMTATPTPDTTKGAFGLVTGLWRSNDRRLANGLPIPAGRWWMPVLAASAFAGGVLSSFPRRVARCTRSPWLGASCNPDARPATCARCRSVFSPTGRDRPTYWRG
jgi:hypothetical protein